MSTFQFSARTVDFDFCGKRKYSLPMTDETQKRVQSAAKYLVEQSAAAKDSSDGKMELDTLRDYVMDAIDDILGEGAADEILSLKEGYTFWDAADVFKYITDEINEAARMEAAKYASQVKTTPIPVNRSQRRNQRKGRHKT